MTLTIDLAVMFRFLALALFFAVSGFIVIMLVGRVRRFWRSRRFDATDRRAMRRRWQEIERLIAAGNEVSSKLAVVEADKLLDQALKSMAMPGSTLGERLKFAAYKFPQIRRVWWAHKVRNQLVHEASYHLERRMARGAVKEFKRALQLLGVL